MFCRMVNSSRVLMVLVSARKTLNPQDHTIFRNTCPQIRQARTLPNVFKPRNYCSVAEVEVQETNQILNILKENEWCHETEEKLNVISDISEDHVVSALKTLNPDKAVSFFEWYKKTASYKPSSPVYNAMLRAVGKKNHVQKFWEIAEEMKRHGFFTEPSTYPIVMAKFQRERITEDIIKLFNWIIEEEKEKPSAHNCYSVLNYLSRDKAIDMDAAYRVIEAYKKCGGSMDKDIYDGLHRCLARAGRFDEAEKVMESMTKEGFIPDNVTYSQLIYGLCNSDRLKDARKTILGMQKKGCVPDSKTWTVVIKGHYLLHKTDKAMALFSEMLESGCDVDSKVLQGLVTHLCEKAREMDAYELLCNSTEEQKLKPSLVTYKEIIKSLTRSGFMKPALRMLEQMIEHGYSPFVGPFYECIIKFGDVEDAHSFLMMTRENDLLSEKSSYALLTGFCSAGRQSDSHDLVSRFPPEFARSSKIAIFARGRSSDESGNKDSTENGGKGVEKATMSAV